MKTPDKICLIDMGDEIAWCDSVPSSDIDERDVVFYEKSDKVKKLRDALEWLVKLKDSKDKHGKTTEYTEDKEAAWESARKALNP